MGVERIHKEAESLAPGFRTQREGGSHMAITTELRPGRQKRWRTVTKEAQVRGAGGRGEVTGHAFDAEVRTAFVLSGGGNLGAVQVGMLFALVEAGIRPDLVVGTSIGALNGAYLAGHNDLLGMQRLCAVWSGVRRPDVFSLNLGGLLRGVVGRRDHLFEDVHLRDLIIRADLGFTRLEEAPIPVYVVATDLLSGEPVVLSSGNTIEALLASAAIPGVFSPVTVGDRVLVDGGLVANLPVLQAVELGATRLFVLPTMSDKSASAPRGAVEMLQRSMAIATLASIRSALARAAESAELHLLPVPAMEVPSMFDFGGTPAMIESAYLTAAAWVRAHELELAS
jgi:NTE family protein